MFSLSVTAPVAGGDGRGRWGADRRGLTAPGGRIAPFDHPMVGWRAAEDASGRIGVAVYERPYGSEPGGGMPPDEISPVGEGGLAAARGRLREWPLHWFWIEIAGDRLSIDASGLPTVPVFLAGDGRTALADWDPLALYPSLQPRLDWEAAAYYLASFDQPYSTRTVIKGLDQLAAGHRARWTEAEGWTVDPPASAPQPYRRLLTPAADPVASLDALVEAAISRLFPDPACPLATALSGGLDSTLVASAATRGGRRVSSFGLVLPGGDLAAQIERRRLIAAACGLADQGFDAADLPTWLSPAAPAATGRMVPWEELHYGLFDALYRTARQAGHAAFLSGFGGDELCEPYWDELADPAAEIGLLSGDADLPGFLSPAVREGHRDRVAAQFAKPVAFAQDSVMQVAATVAAQHLRNGLWPVHPLIAPDVVRYCHSLPLEWRRDRKLVRSALERLGLPPAVCRPASTENFATLTAAGLRSSEFADWLRAERLEAAGLVDPGLVEDGYAAWCEGRAPADLDANFIAVAVLEATLASLE